MNFVNYTVSRADEFRRYAEKTKREEVLALLSNAKDDDSYVVPVHSGFSDAASNKTRLALFFGPNGSGGAGCRLCQNLSLAHVSSDPKTSDTSHGFAEFRPPQCNVLGEIGCSRQKIVSLAIGSTDERRFH